MEDFGTFENEMMQQDNLLSTDIKINPDYYIHDTIVKATASLSNVDVRDRFLQYRQFIEHLEILCKAAGKIPNDFDDKINQFKETDEFKNLKGDDIRAARIVNKKLELILGDVFSSKLVSTSLKFSHRMEKLKSENEDYRRRLGLAPLEDQEVKRLINNEGEVLTGEPEEEKEPAFLAEGG